MNIKISIKLFDQCLITIFPNVYFFSYLLSKLPTVQRYG